MFFFVVVVHFAADAAAVADVLILVHKQNFTSTKYDYEHENFAYKIYLAKTLAEWKYFTASLYYYELFYKQD